VFGQSQISLTGCFLSSLRYPEGSKLANPADNGLILVALLPFQFEHALESLQSSIHD
jgi:hypothetical protein